MFVVELFTADGDDIERPDFSNDHGMTAVVFTMHDKEP